MRRPLSLWPLLVDDARRSRHDTHDWPDVSRAGRLAEERRKRVAVEQEECAKWREEYAQLTDKRKQLWRRDAELRKERKATEEELAKAERTLREHKGDVVATLNTLVAA